MLGFIASNSAQSVGLIVLGFMATLTGFIASNSAQSVGPVLQGRQALGKSVSSPLIRLNPWDR